MNKSLRILINFAITATLILIFKNVGWIEFIAPPPLLGDGFFNSVLIAGIIGTLMLIIGEFFDFIYKVAKFATLGFAKLLAPLYAIAVGYLKVFLPTLLLPNWYSHTSSIFAILIIAILIGLIRIPAKK
ncbi:hypothetical protein KC717_04655 [Candidatus Dojkabacteria bacterium]|uniref:Uncharacterized protein n=1 Tax=Candidatus Dojkabacteria bacterium TaxID=2099670 RepID=A0A955L8E1_9BACT|nr:hypothetical protein [Candidatus Dojkabacteria bacterium]